MGQQSRRVSIVNTETGEHTDALITEENTAGGAPKRPRVKFDDSYAIVFEQGLRRLASDRNITGTMHRVIAALMLRAPITGEPFPSNAKGIAKLTGMTPNAVAKAYGDMVTQGLLRRPAYGVLAFNPRYFWRGPAERRQQAVVEELGGTILSQHAIQSPGAGTPAEKIASGYATEEEGTA